MALLKATARVSGVSTGTSALTLVQIAAPTNQRLKLLEIGVSFHGISNTDAPITVDLYQSDDAGTASALTLVKEDSDLGETLQATAQKTFTVEPATNVVVKRTWAVHPQTGLVLLLSPNDEIVVPGGKKINLRVTAGVSVPADAYLRYEE